MRRYTKRSRRLAQLVEHHLHTVGVIGSSPIAPTNPQMIHAAHVRRKRSGVFIATVRRPIRESVCSVRVAFWSRDGATACMVLLARSRNAQHPACRVVL